MTRNTVWESENAGGEKGEAREALIRVKGEDEESGSRRNDGYMGEKTNKRGKRGDGDSSGLSITSLDGDD